MLAREPDHAMRTGRHAELVRTLAVLATGLVVVSIYAFPGFMAWDSVEQLAQARAGQLTDWHPPLMSAIWGVLDRIVPGAAAMFVLQNSLFLVGLHALLRRRPAGADETLAVADLRLDPRARVARRGERELDLTRREFELLQLFMRHPGEIVDRRRLHEEVWGYTFDPGTNVADVFVGYVRRKLEQDGEPRVLHTVRGVGFVLRP
jgi:hypothetical protein